MTKNELKEVRVTLGLSQQKMADLIKTTKRTWQDWEYGINPVPGPVGCLLILLLKYKGAASMLRDSN